MLGPTDHTRLGQLRNVPRSALASPAVLVSLIVGKNAAFATPIRADEASRSCSASTMSGRRCSSADGSPAGTSGGVMFDGLAVTVKPAVWEQLLRNRCDAEKTDFGD